MRLSLETVPTTATRRLRDERGALLDRPGLIAALTLSAPFSEPFQRLAELVRSVLGSTAALVGFLTDEFEYSAGFAGPEDEGGVSWKHPAVPAAHSLCRFVVSREEAVVLSDARKDPEMALHPGVADYGVVAYAGVPITTASGQTIGALCALGDAPRVWTARESGLLEQFAEFAAAEIEARAAALLEQQLMTVQAAEAKRNWQFRETLAVRLHDRVLQDLLAVGQDLQESDRQDLMGEGGPLQRGYAAVRELRDALSELSPGLSAGAYLGDAISAIAARRRDDLHAGVRVLVHPEAAQARSPLLLEAADMLLEEALASVNSCEVLIEVKSLPERLQLVVDTEHHPGASTADAQVPARTVAAVAALTLRLSAAGGELHQEHRHSGWRVTATVPRPSK